MVSGRGAQTTQGVRVPGLSGPRKLVGAASRAKRASARIHTNAGGARAPARAFVSGEGTPEPVDESVLTAEVVEAVEVEEEEEVALPGLRVERRQLLAGVAGAGVLAQSQANEAEAKPINNEWEVVNLPLPPEVVLLDIAFVPDNPKRGFLLGTKQTLLETNDGGKTWTKKGLEAAQDEGFNYRFNSISFSGNEGYIVGKPPILLHTSNGGDSWERVPLNAKLPGTPVLITALPGEGQAEMTTDVGAIYVTSNAGLLWKAAVQETVDATLNRTVSSGISGASFYTGQFSSVKRSPEGKYVAVSSRGNFYMTWEPGQTFWQPHNRASARRLQDMGWRPEGGLWLATRGGDLFFNNDEKNLENFKQVNFGARGFGILDVGFQPDGTLWAAGGSGTLYKSADGGKKWKRTKSADKIPGNLYAVKFVNEKQGFILGNASILLRYIGA